MTATVATGIHSTHVEAVWADLWPLLEPAYALVPDCQKQSVLAGVRARNLTLWAVYSNNRPIAGIVTRPLLVGTSSTETHCQIWLIGGARLFDWAADFLSKLKPWAAESGFASILAAGVRPGWERLAPKLGFVSAFHDGPDHYWRLSDA